MPAPPMMQQSERHWIFFYDYIITTSSQDIIKQRDEEIANHQQETMELLFVKESAYKNLAAENADMKEELGKQAGIRRELEQNFTKEKQR